MNFLMYFIFYIITAFIIVNYLFNEKKVVAYVDKFSNKFIDKLNLENIFKTDIKLLKIVSFFFIISLAMLVFRIDFSPNEIIPLKNKVLYFAIAINFLIYFISFIGKYYFETLAILNIILIVFSKSMAAIDDVNYIIFLVASTFFSLFIILIFNLELRNKLKKIFNAIFLILLVLIIQNFYLGNYVIPTGSMENTILVGDRIFANNIIYRFKNPKVGDIIAFKEPLDDSNMYTKRITGEAGETLKINNEDFNIYLNGEKSILNRKYSVKGLLELFNNPEIYIPKKGDKVKLSHLIEYDINNGIFKEITVDEFLSNNISYKYYKNIFGIFNYKNFDEISNYKRYTYLLSVEGKEDKLVLPILDFKYDKNTMESLLNGEYIELKDNYYMAMGDNTNNSNDSRYFGYVKESRIYGKLLFRWYPFNRFGTIKDETN